MGYKIVHEKLGVNYELPELLQGEMETFEAEYQTFAEARGIQLSVFSGCVVRTAAKIGWLNGLKEEDVAKMNPGAVLFISNHIAEAIMAAREIPPS